MLIECWYGIVFCFCLQKRLALCHSWVKSFQIFAINYICGILACFDLLIIYKHKEKESNEDALCNQNMSFDDHCRKSHAINFP